MRARVVRLGDFCRQDRVTVRAGECSDLRYIGLETIESNTGQFHNGALSKTPEVPEANSFRFGADHVLYGKLRPYLNKVGLPNFAGKCSTEIVPLRPEPELDRRYLAYFLRCPNTVARICERTAGARMPRADMHFILDLPLALPPIEEQKRIVDLLARAEGIVRLRREAEKKAQAVIPALFLAMFGDPATNPKGLPLRRVGDFVDRFEGGKNLQAGSEGGSDFRILKVSAVTTGTYVESESKPTPNGYSAPSTHIVRAGDLLFSRANTKELVGATAIVEATNDRTLLPDKLWRIVWSEPVEPRYIHALFQTDYARRELGKLSSGTSASMRNISQAKLVELCLPVAPVTLQRVFANRALALHSVVESQRLALKRAEATFHSLIRHTFEMQDLSRAN